MDLNVLNNERRSRRHGAQVKQQLCGIINALSDVKGLSNYFVNFWHFLISDWKICPNLSAVF